MLKRFPALLGLLVAAAAVPAAAPAMAQQVAVADTARLDWWQLDPETDGVPGIALQRAYRELLAGQQPKQSVTVAIIDSGIDVEHPALKPNIWTNPKEVAGNGADDDGNGYVDDVHGWDFIGGADGKDVDADTYEVTRLYSSLRTQCVPTSQPAPACERWPEIRTAFEKQRDETQEQLQQYRMITTAMEQFATLLKRELKTDSLTIEKVAALRTSRPDVAFAQEKWLLLMKQGATPEVLAEGMKSLENGVKYSLNPEFDPRPIVGDDYANTAERAYGNNEVRGPDATHGTHVAGIVGGVREGAAGMTGVFPGVKIMVVRAVPDGDERDKDVANAIRYAVDNGAKVINMSFGKGYSPQKSAVDEAVKYAEAHGVLLVHGAGNDAESNDSTENFPNRRYLDGGEASNWIEVGASSWQDREHLAASFSNYGHTAVDVFAPGTEIYSSVPDGGYRRMQGTSMASPVVTGAAALILAYHPELTPAQVRQIIIDSATRYPDLRVVKPGAEDREEPVPFANLSVSGGVLNVYEALKLAAARGGQQ